MKSPVKFGKYYLLERINVGGMAEVFKAKSFGEAGFERLVAVKRILPSVAEDQEFIAMFVDEAKLAVQLTHPNIAQIFELGKVNESYFIALEYVTGRDLRAIFERGKKKSDPLPIPMACYTIMRLCEGLDYAHNKKDAAGRNLDLVHRDVSPQNVLLSWDGDVKLIDFGIAKAASKSTRTQAGILKGKFGYMSPEQVRGQGVDRRSDVFAAGICLYELLTMQRLFSGNDDYSTLEKVRNCDFPPPSQINKAIPEELEVIVMKALAKNVEERHRTAIDLHDELQSFMYTSGHFFSRKDLAGFMQRSFQEEITKEAARDDEYRKFDSRRASDLDVFDGAQAPNAMTTNGRNVPPPPPGAPRVSVPPPPPPSASRVPKATMMGVGMNAPAVGAPAVPPPPMKTLMGQGPGVGPNGLVAAPPGQSAQSAKPAAGLEMEWDDEELATQVYDRQDGIPFPKPSAGPVAPSVTSAPLPSVKSIPPPPAANNGRGPVAPPPGFSSLPPANGLPGAQYAPPRAMTQPLPSVTNAPKALPAIPAPPPGSNGLSIPAPNGQHQGPQVPSMHSGFPGQNTHPPMQQQGAAPAVGAPPMAGGYSMGPGTSPPAPAVGAPRPPQGMIQQPTAPFNSVGANTAAHAAMKKNNQSSPLPFVLAAVGAVALIAGGGLVYVFTRPKFGALEVSTNVPDVQLEVDGIVRPGTGQRFTVSELEAGRTHHVIGRRTGYRAREIDVQVAHSEISAVQMVLEPEERQVAQNTQPQQVMMQPIMQPMMQPVMQQPVMQPVIQQPVMQPVMQPVIQQPVIQQPQQVVVQQPVPQPAQVAANPTPSSRSSGGSHRSGGSRNSGGSSSSSSSPRIVSSSSSGSSGSMGGSSMGGSMGGGGGSGFLSISTRPASRCTVAGQTFSTPRLRISLPGGTHRVQCNNGDFNVGATFSVTIRPGQETREINHPLN